MASEATAAGDRFNACLAEFGAALERLACAYEADAELRRDLSQEILTALWRSLAAFDGRCSLRTWTYRVAHNTAVDYVARRVRGQAAAWMRIEDLEAEPTADVRDVDRQIALTRVMALVQRLHPLDKQLVLLWLEGLDTAAIAAVTGLSVTNVNTRVHRAKALLARLYHEGDSHNNAGTTIAAASRLG